MVVIITINILILLYCGCGNNSDTEDAQKSGTPVVKAVTSTATPAVTATVTPTVTPTPITEVFDVAIRGGRVMDPESGFDKVANVGISGDIIKVITEQNITAEHIIDLNGSIVSPGFIDINIPFSPEVETYKYIQYWKVLDGVTSGFWFHDGTTRAASFENRFTHGFYINCGVSTSVAEYLWSGFPLKDRYKAARYNIENGALGISMSPEYTPQITLEEAIEYGKIAREYDLPIMMHLRYSIYDKEIEGVKEAIAIARASKARVHIFHLSSTGGMYNMEEALSLIKAARDEGLEVDADVYPYSYWMSFIDSNRFLPGWEKGSGFSYEDIYYIPLGNYLTEELFKEYRPRGGRVLVPEGTISWEKSIIPALNEDFVFFASDGSYNVSRYYTGMVISHPRDTGSHATTIYESKRIGLPLMTTLKKMTLDPARFLERGNSSYQRRGRLQEGCFADITVFDYNTTKGMGTVFNPGVKSRGIEAVIVNGTVLYEKGFFNELNPGRYMKNTVVKKDENNTVIVKDENNTAAGRRE